METFTRMKVTGFGVVPRAGVSRLPRRTRGTFPQRCVELGRSGCCLSCVFDPPPRPADTCWKGAKAPFLVPNVTTGHGNIRGSMDSLVSLGSAVAAFISCVEGELQSSASPTFTLRSPRYLTLSGSRHHLFREFPCLGNEWSREKCAKSRSLGLSKEL